MFLWTIQPKEVYNFVMETGVYCCDPFKSGLLKPFDESLVGIELEPVFKNAYDWITFQMEQKISPRPEGVVYPVWAWYQFAGKKKPDLRRERWANGCPGETLACITLEVPDKEVLLSDFGAWHHVLNNWPIADTEEEADRFDDYLDHASEEEKKAFLKKNWERVFDTSLFNNGFHSRGDDIQATFWELKKNYIKNVRFFVAGSYKKQFSR